MIVPMKKIFVVCQRTNAGDAVECLRHLGVFHVEYVRHPQAKELAALQEDACVYRAALEMLSRYSSKKICAAAVQTARQADWRHLARHIVDIEKRIDQLREYGVSLGVRIKEWERWGDFDPDRLRMLQKKGIFIRLFEIPEKEIAALPAQLIAKTIFRSGGIVSCAVVSREPVEIPYRQVGLPQQGLAGMRRKLAEDRRVIERMEKELCSLVSALGGISEELRRTEKRLEFISAVEGMGQEGGLAYLAGYVPSEALEKVGASVRSHRWALLARDPSPEDIPPTLLRHPKWVAIIQPLLRFLGIVPGYRELDAGAPFLIFFSIFFGILIGDAGYGLMYLLLTRFWLQKKLGPQHASTAVLLYILSCAAILWGALTGSFFGQAWLADTGINALMPGLNNAKTLQAFCFFLGALHLSLAHSWRTVLKLPSLSALADVGWLLIVWAAFFLARTLILGEAFPVFGKPLLIAGVSLVAVFTNPQKNMLKAVGEGLGTIALGLVNSFTDVVSYIRLFAVGMAGVAIADATNGMAVSAGNGIAACVIVLIGHLLNLVLGPMSVLVHGVRLNVLEFSSHASITWSGTAYTPLAE